MEREGNEGRRRAAVGPPDGIDESLYRVLEARAHALLRSRRLGQDPETASLVNRACVNLLQRAGEATASRQRFLALSAAAMRNVLVDIARMQGTTRRGGGRGTARFDEATEAAGVTNPGAAVVLDVHEKLEKLDRHDNRLAKLVRLRYFGGLTWAEVGEVLGESEAELQKSWYFARAWFRSELSDPRSAALE